MQNIPANLYKPALPNKNRLTTYEYDALGRRTKTTTDAGAPYAQTTLIVYDALSRVVRTIANYVANATIPDPYVHRRTDFTHGANNDQNLVAATAYNERGFVKNQTDVLGNVTLYGYDDAGRLIKTISSVSQPNYDNSYGSNGDPTLSHYIVSTAADQDLVSTSQYDAVGNLVKTIDAVGNVSLTGYDALNRPVRTIQNASQPNYNVTADPTLSQYAVSTASDQDMLNYTEYDALGHVTRTQDALGSWTLYGYDGLGRQVKLISSASQPSYTLTADPTLSQYKANPAADLDLITQTAYDTLGRVLYTTDVLGRRNWSVYDGVGRVVRTVANASGAATDGSVHDPRSPSYGALQVPDQDLISTTTYDSNGYVLWTLDALGHKTWYGYDNVGRQVRTVTNALGTALDGGINDPRSSLYIPNTAPDLDVVSQTVYNPQGRVAATIDPQGNQTQFTYDALGRRTQTIVNFTTGVYRPSVPDQDLISTTTYDFAGRVTATVDPRGTRTTYTYDRLGRRLTTTQAAGTGQAITNYTCYDKGGRVLRVIQNWINDPRQPSPDARDANGNWLFATPFQGNTNDRNLISRYTFDQTGRQTTTNDPLGNAARMTYAKDGQLVSMTDPLGVITTYRYDRARRRTLTVQSYTPINHLLTLLADPSTWYWNTTANQWKDGRSGTIHDGLASDPTDQNVIAMVVYDKAGRVLSQRDPKGNLTTYAYDLLNRRTRLNDPLNHTWTTTYALTGNGATQTTMTDPVSQVVQTTDRLGRLLQVKYPKEIAPKPTPELTFAYDKLGNRLLMSENNGLAAVRKTNYQYDRARRLTQVVFDVNGDGSTLQPVGYQYDAGGLRQQMTLPGVSQPVAYQYNARGQLTALTDWNGQTVNYSYDSTARLVAANRPNGLLSQYQYDAAGHLLTLQHTANGRTLASFAYTLDARGNRTQAYEAVAQKGTPTNTTYLASDPAVSYYAGNWSASGGFMTTTDMTAALRLSFVGTQATLSMGSGPDHGLYDIYLDGDLWNSGDGFASAPITQTFTFGFNNDGPHRLEIRNRPDRSLGNTTAPAIYRLRFQTLSVTGQPNDLRTTRYSYDALSRLVAADSYAATNTNSTVQQHYAYGYDLAGNRLSATDGAITTSYAYDATNRLATSQIGAGATTTYTYDNAGRLTNDGTNTYTWDSANRMLSVGSTTYQYNGFGQRVQQIAGGQTIQYLLDVQSGLQKVLQATTSGTPTRYIHGPFGIQQQYNSIAPTAPLWMIQDGLGSVRGIIDNMATPQESRRYSPYGEVFQTSGVQQTNFGFTGEETDVNGLLNLRARSYNPTIGQFMSLDPFVGNLGAPMSLNRYAYVQDNPINWRDPSGLEVPCPECGQAGGNLGGAAPGTAEGGGGDATTHSLPPPAYTPNGGSTGPAVPGFRPYVAPPANPAIISPYNEIVDTYTQTSPSPGLTMGMGISKATSPATLPPTTATNVNNTCKDDKTPEPEEFVGYHGTSSVYAPSILAKINPPPSAYGGVQLGQGFYVVSTCSGENPQEIKMKLTTMVNTFATMASERSGGSNVILKIYARGFSQMSGYEVPSGNWDRSYPTFLNASHDYLTAPIDGYFGGCRQIKFNSRAYDKLRASL